MRRRLGLIMTVLIFLAVTGAFNYYIYRRFITSAGIESTGWLWGIRILVVVLTLSYVLARWWIATDINFASKGFLWFSSTWMGVLFYLFLITVAAHFVAIVLKLTGGYGRIEAALNMNMGSIGLIAVIALTLIVTGYGHLEAYRKADVTELEIPMKNLHAKLDGLTVVHISDLHLGVVVRAKRFERRVNHINSLNPDLILMTGDLIDENPKAFPGIIEQFGRLQSTYGVYAAPGNHEFYHGLGRITRALEEKGIRMLRNEKVEVVEGLNLYGVDDPASKRIKGTRAAFGEVIGPEAKSQADILMYHQPHKFERAAALGIDLMLSGHTHKGQLWPFVFMSKLNHPRVTGHHTVDGSHLYVTQGLGTWGPAMRVGSPPEIVKITLRADKTEE